MTENLMSATPDSNKAFISTWWGLFVLFTLGFPLFFMFKPTIDLENYGAIPPFELTDHQGKIYRSVDSQKPLVVNFIFTRCTNVCPLLSGKMQVLQEQTSTKDVQLLSITVDPKYDTPSVLQQYSQRFENHYEHWKMLTGNADQVREIVRSFQQTYEVEVADPNAPSIMHSERFVLIDSVGQIRGFFRSDNSSLNDLINAIDSL